MNNMEMLIHAFKNPQDFLQNAMNNSQMMQNPIAKNTIEMMQKGDSAGLEKTARNLCKEHGINADDAMKQVKSMFGM